MLKKKTRPIEIVLPLRLSQGVNNDSGLAVWHLMKNMPFLPD